MSAERLTRQILDAEFVDIGEQRRGDRRQRDRRAPRARLDTLFAATLVNHITAPERPRCSGYAAAVELRPGVVVNVRA